MMNYYPREKQLFEYFIGQTFTALVERKKNFPPPSRKVPI